MHIPRLYIPQALIEGEALVLDDQAAHHVRQVLRLGPAATLRVFDGRGSEHHATLIEVQRNRVSIEVGTAHKLDTESPLDITLAQGIPRGDRMDLILQKAVELGVSRLQPLWMERSQARTRGDRLERRMRHWERVMISACEQCGRNRLPGIDRPTGFTTWLGTGLTADTRILLDPEAGTTLTGLAPPQGSLLLLAGPEGGITETEKRQAETAGFTPVALGPRVLRTETAPLAVLACLQVLWGDFR